MRRSWAVLAAAVVALPLAAVGVTSMASAAPANRPVITTARTFTVLAQATNFTMINVDGRPAVESPREQMESEWRDIRGRATWSPEASTTHVYQKYVSGKPRMSSARAALDYFHVPNAGDMAAIGIAHAGEARLLAAAGADIVVSTLDHVDTTALAAGRLATRKT